MVTCWHWKGCEVENISTNLPAITKALIGKGIDSFFVGPRRRKDLLKSGRKTATSIGKLMLNKAHIFGGVQQFMFRDGETLTWICSTLHQLVLHQLIIIIIFLIINSLLMFKSLETRVNALVFGKSKTGFTPEFMGNKDEENIWETSSFPVKMFPQQIHGSSAPNPPATCFKVLSTGDSTAWRWDRYGLYITNNGLGYVYNINK